MAAIDHTCIYFHNGKLMKDIFHCDWVEKVVDYTQPNGTVDKINEIRAINEVELLPFKASRDGLFYHDRNTSLDDMERIFPEVYFKHKWQEKRAIKLFDKDQCKAWDKYPEQDFENRVYWYKDLQKLIITQHTKQYCLTFYFNLTTKDSWVVLGGYGHGSNPYTHFYDRGYGEEFELKMTYEAYKWICEDLLPNLLECCFSNILEDDKEYNNMGVEYTEYYIKLANMLRFKNYWSMVCNTSEEKQEEYWSVDSMKYDLGSLFLNSKTYIETECGLLLKEETDEQR